MGIVTDVDLRLLRYFVAVAEERHFGRAARRLHMTQPPLSRAIRQLEDELDATLLRRSPQGVELTAAGVALYDEALTLLRQAEHLRARVRTAAGTATLIVGTLADTAEQVGSVLVAAFRTQHPDASITIHETDLGDPTAGLRTGVVDVALTRTPFDDRGIATRTVRTDALGVVLRADDPLAKRAEVTLTELVDRTWVRLPDGTDPTFAAYWTGHVSDTAPVVRTIQECLQSVLWSGTCALAPVNQTLPAGLVVVALADRPPTQLVIAWKHDKSNPLVQSFIEIATTTERDGTTT